MTRERRQIKKLEPLKKLRTTMVQGLIGLVLLLLPQQGHALSFTVDSDAVSVSTTFDLNIEIADAVDLTSWQFDLAYDPTILQANSVTEGPFLLSTGGPTAFSPGLIDNTTGLITLVTNSYNGLTPPSGSDVLATISFTALAQGISPVTASNVFLDFSDSGFTIGNGSVTVTGDGAPVPEASTISMMALGLLLLWGLRRWCDAEESAEAHR